MRDAPAEYGRAAPYAEDAETSSPTGKYKGGVQILASFSLEDGLPSGDGRGDQPGRRG